MIDPRFDLLFEFIESTPQRTWERRHGGQHQAKTGSQNPRVDARAKYGDAESKVGEAVTVSLGNAFNQAVQAESTQLISHSTLGELVLRLAAQGGQIDSQVSVGESGRQQMEKQQRVPDCLYHWIGEAKSRSPLPIHHVGLIELLEGLFGEN